MNDATSKYLARYPSARTSTITYLQKRAAMTEKLRQEIAIHRRPSLWARAVNAIRGYTSKEQG